MKDVIKDLYPKNNSYITSSVYSEPQQESFLKTLISSFDLLIELCRTLPHQIKKIVYLAEDIIEIAKSIPSHADKNKFVDMRNEICDTIHNIANHAPLIEMGLPINIDKEIYCVCDSCKRYNT